MQINRFLFFIYSGIISKVNAEITNNELQIIRVVYSFLTKIYSLSLNKKWIVTLQKNYPVMLTEKKMLPKKQKKTLYFTEELGFKIQKQYFTAKK